MLDYLVGDASQQQPHQFGAPSCLKHDQVCAHLLCIDQYPLVDRGSTTRQQLRGRRQSDVGKSLPNNLKQIDVLLTRLGRSFRGKRSERQ